jgi:Rad3-related DNA helicase
MHLACAEKNGLKNIDIQLTYYNVDTDEIKRIRKGFKFNDLSEFFFELIDKYLIWAKLTREWCIVRDESIKKTKFPYKTYRNGQRELAVSVYKTICESKKIFVQAPTGIGKTISTLFPSIKAMGEGKITKIFYLTAKTITRQVAEESIDEMRHCGLTFKSITLTAKDKICFKESTTCNPEDCEFAKGHFDRVDEAITDLFKNENAFTRDTIKMYAKKYTVCPFELSLDLSLWADCIVCDYNYVFDPRVYLKRFFQLNTANYTFLIDEAHNLVDRSREMFSAEIFKDPFLQLKKIYKTKEMGIYKILNKLNTMMINMKKKCEINGYFVQSEEPKEIYILLKRFIKESEPLLSEDNKTESHNELLELYFNVLTFLKVAEFYDKKYVTYLEKSQSDIKLKIFCLDPSFLLSEALKRGKSAIFFSATLTPIDYFRDILGGDEDNYRMRLSSPFDVKNLSLLIANKISTKYDNREKSYSEIAKYIHEVIVQKIGNYMVFFPSYKYMNEVVSNFREMYPDVDTIVQSNSMTEEDREKFLDRFKSSTEEILLGFTVLGGIFSEGIDLKGDMLLGAIVIGVGLPKVCLERNIIMDYFKEKNGRGYEYSYMYPGMNKVLQASGRVIRSENDRGIVLLIDERFSKFYYKKLFPAHWNSYNEVSNLEQLNFYIKDFWNKG